MSKAKRKRQKQGKCIKQAATAESCPNHSVVTLTLKPFMRFRPDGDNSENLKDMILALGFFTGKCGFLPPSLKPLFDIAYSGNRDAAKSLVDITVGAALSVAALEGAHPQMMGKIARKMNLWPIVASTTHPNLARDAQARLTKLGLSQDLHQLDTPFRKAHGADQNYPARRWAKAAVYCVNLTRLLQRQIALYESKVSVGETLWPGCWKRGIAPQWASEAKDLPDFSNQKDTLAKWAKVIRKMIREQTPDFHLLPEWEYQRNSCKLNEADTKGEIQNAILDDIVSALRTVAPVLATGTC
ncbi:MAG: hypothetical protein ABSA83_20190 [Verrucomicrobiota bacterium]|jgi:hypothetical protein